MFANCQMMGVDMGFPDVCKTPPVAVPIPYPNIGMGPTGVPAAYNVLVSVGPGHNMATTVPFTLGDTAGVMMGLVSQTVDAPARHVTAMFTCLMGGLPATRMTSVAIGNMIDCPGMRLVPSQVKVLLLGP